MIGSMVLVTGANGFLGRNLIHRLAGMDDVSVYAVSRRVPHVAAKLPHVRWRQLDIRDLESLRLLMLEVRPEIIYHLAGDCRGGQEIDLVLPSFQNDVQTTINVLLAACELGSPRLVIPASLEEPVDGQNGIPNSPYATAKVTCRLYAEMFHSVYGLPVVLLRTFMTYGPWQKPYKLIPYVIQSLLKGQSPTVGSGTRLVDWIYVDDVITAFVNAARSETAVGETIDVGSGTLVSIQELVDRLHGLIPGSPCPNYSPKSARAREVVRRADIQMAEQLLSWRPNTSLAEGLSRTVDWYRFHTSAGEELMGTTQRASYT